MQSRPSPFSPVSFPRKDHSATSVDNLDSTAFHVPVSPPGSPSRPHLSHLSLEFNPSTQEVIDLTRTHSESPMSISSDNHPTLDPPHNILCTAEMFHVPDTPPTQMYELSYLADSLFDVPPSPLTQPRDNDDLPASMFNVPDSPPSQPRDVAPREVALATSPTDTPMETNLPSTSLDVSNLIPYLPPVTRHSIMLQRILAELLSERSYVQQRVETIRGEIRQMDDNLQALKSLEIIRRAMAQIPNPESNR